MTELKTLKDFDNFEFDFSCGKEYDARSVKLGIQKERRRLIDELKEKLAIKWVKMLQTRIDKGIAYDFEKSKIEWKAQIDILRIVFNITEEDLK